MMKKVLLILVLSVTIWAQTQPKAVHFVEDPWPPFTFGELSGEPTKGAAVEALKMVFANYALKLSLYPWKRAVTMAQEGVADGLMLTVETTERQNFFVFSEPLFYDEIVFIVNADSAFRYRGIDSLEGLKIGTILGSKYSDAFQEALAQKKFEAIPTDELQTNIKKLSSKRIDTMIASRIAFCGAIKEMHEPSRYTILSPAFQTIEFKIAISKKSPLKDEMETINSRIRQLKTEHQLDAITTRYFDVCMTTKEGL